MPLYTVSPFFIPDTDYYTAPLSSSFADDPANYLQVIHDAIDGVATGVEQMQSFIQFFADRVGAVVNFTQDAGTPGTPSGTMPPTNPTVLSATYTFNNAGLPNTWTLAVRWGFVDNTYKEYYLKRMYRLIELQLRDNDNARMIARSGQGALAFQTDGLVSPTPFVTMLSIVPAAALGAGTNSFTVNAGLTAFTVVLNNPVGAGLTEATLRAIFNNYITYRSRGTINPATLTWITDQSDTVTATNMALTFNVQADPIMSTYAISIMDYLSTGAFSIYDRLVYELCQDIPPTGVNASSKKVYDGYQSVWVSYNATTVSSS